MSQLIVGVDGTIVNVALPTIRTDLNASISELQWSIDAYTLVLASLLITIGLHAATGSGARASSSSAWPCSRSDTCCAASRRTCSC